MAAVISDPQHRATPEIFKDTVLPFPNLFLTVMVKMVWISHVPDSGPSQRDDQVPYNKYFLTLQSLQAFVSLLPIISMSCSVGYFWLYFYYIWIYLIQYINQENDREPFLTLQAATLNPESLLYGVYINKLAWCNFIFFLPFSHTLNIHSHTYFLYFCWYELKKEKCRTFRV